MTDTLDARLAPEHREEKIMLDQLVESKNNSKGNRKLSGILMATSMAVFSALTFALIFSLFSHTLAMGNENLDVTTLVSPISPPDEAPPEPIKQQQPTERTVSQLPSRQIDMLRTEESPTIVPKNVSVTQNQQKSRPVSGFTISPIDTAGIPSGDGRPERSGNSQSGEGLLSDKQPPQVEIKNEIPKPPPIIKPTPKPEPSPKKTIVSEGVINGKASYLAQPSYPAAARAVHANGQVKVQVMIDEEGKVISANVISGHPLLQSAALSAAKSSKFTPTFLSKEKVKVSGFIIYNFLDR